LPALARTTIRKEPTMPTYITLARLTTEGARNAKQLPEKLAEALRIAEELGVTFRAYMLMGPYDFIGIAQAPDDETIARVNLSICARGDVQTQTMRAFDELETERIFSGLR
jgi:uncharacterized protein with GYD domain